MSNVPTWLASTAKTPGNSGAINQLNGAHTTTFLYSGGSITSQQATGSAVFQSSQNNWVSQTIVTGSSQTSIGSVNLQLSVVGGSPTLNLIPVLTVALYADGSGFPAGTPLVSTTISNNYVYTSPFWVSVPLPTAVTPSTQYHVVTNLVGSASHYYTWQQSNQTSGAATAPDGVTWTFQSFGMMYQVFDQTSTGQITTIFEDNGAMFSTLTYNTQNLPSVMNQFVTAQGGGYIQSSGTLSYTNGFLTGVS